MQRVDSLEKTLLLGKIEGRRKRGWQRAEDKMVGRHRWLNGREFEQTLGDGEEQGSSACFSPWGPKDSDTTDRTTTNSRGKVHFWNVVVFQLATGKYTTVNIWTFCFCSLVITLCPTLCDHMPGFYVFHYLPEFAQTHVHWVGDSIQPSQPLLPPSPPAFSISQHQGLF